MEQSFSLAIIILFISENKRCSTVIPLSIFKRVTLLGRVRGVSIFYSPSATFRLRRRHKWEL